MFDMEYALRKTMYDLQVADGDPFNLPTFAGQATCPQFDPDGDEERIDKHTVVELFANIRLNQALSLHPTTDAIAQRIDDEERQILRDSTREISWLATMMIIALFAYAAWNPAMASTILLWSLAVMPKAVLLTGIRQVN